MLGLDEEVGALKVLCEVDFDSVEVRDVNRLNQQSILFNCKLKTTLEVVLVIHLGELTQEDCLVLGRDVVDANCLTQAALDGLGEFLDLALSGGGVLDLFVGDGRSVH